ncbi:GGDEF domain-containing protein [Marinobacter sp. 1Y8]
MSEPSKGISGPPPVRQRIIGEIPVPTLISWLSLGAVPLLCFFSIRAWGRDDILPIGMLTGIALLLLLNTIVYLLGKNRKLHRRGFIILITVLFMYLALAGIEDGAAVLWLFAYPPIIFYISSLKVGILTCAFGLISLTALFTPVGTSLFGTPYSNSFKLMMISVLAFEMICCFVLDLSRRRAKENLIILAREHEYAAKHDAMTGLANRREGLHQLESEYERYQRNQRRFSVILMDIDLFKSVNDNFGHQAGDKLIALVASKLHETCRKIDTLSRWGGEEFLAILPETSCEEAAHSADRIRKAIAAASITHDGNRINATISAGVASIQGTEPADSLLQRADEALYTAKATGRNKVCKEEMNGV